MTRPRSALVSLLDTPWYHVVSRCVRRAFLCGHDRHSGQNFDHRRGWIEARIAQLASVFAIDVAAYAVMSNHYHIVVRIDAARAAAWSVEEVLTRWTQLFSGPLLVQRYLSPARAGMGEAEVARVEEFAAVYRARLADLSWFMRILNETIARQANQEDGARGRFWEGRFKSQALLDEQALLAAMSYVDLNPIRAAMAETVQDSAHTSIRRRLDELGTPDLREQPEMTQACAAGATETSAELVRPAAASETLDDAPTESTQAPTAAPQARLRGEWDLRQLQQAPLMPFDATGRFELAIPYAFEDYLELVDTVGRAIHPKKRGAIPEKSPRLLTKLGIDTETFIAHASRFLQEFGHAVGTPAKLTELATARQAKFLRGLGTARAVFERAAEQDRQWREGGQLAAGEEW